MNTFLQSRWFPVATASLMTMFLILWLHQCSKPAVDNSVEDENHVLKERVAVLETAIAGKDSVIAVLQASRDAQVKRHTKDSTSQSVQIARLSRGYAKAKQEVQELTDSTGRISAYVQASDSLLAAKDSLYLQEVGHRIAIELSYKSEVALMGEKYVKQVAISDEYAARVEQLGNENRRLGKRLERKRKANGLWKGLALGLGAATTVLILTE